MNNIKAIAIYLPQFHPIPENDEWWGKGFTEWTNVTQSKPLFKGQYQPHLPTDLGFYDLRLNEVFYEQVKMAKEAGIEGFMFYHYWFEGKRLLQTPLENYLADKKIDFPFFLCWANENWTRRWDGADKEVLMKQDYSINDYSKHFDEVLSRFIVDERYIKVNGKPVISIYKTELIPNILELAQVWNNKAKVLGFPGLYLIKVEASDWDTSPNSIGFDASMEFQPNWKILPTFEIPINKYYKLLNSVRPKRIRDFIKNNYFKNSNRIFDYKDYSIHSSKFIEKDYTFYRCVTPSWDNTSRRRNGNAFILKNSSPVLYGNWLKSVIQSFKPRSKEENFVFINAWNEWAEGNHLEPCLKYGREYLEITKEILNS